MQFHPIFRHKGLINFFVVVVGECVVGLGKWKMGKGLRCGYFLKKFMCSPPILSKMKRMGVDIFKLLQNFHSISPNRMLFYVDI